MRRAYSSYQAFSGPMTRQASTTRRSGTKGSTATLRLLAPVARGDRHDPTVLGRPHLGPHVDAQALEQRRERPQLAAGGRGCPRSPRRRSARRASAPGSRRRASRPRAAAPASRRRRRPRARASTFASIAIRATSSSARACSSRPGSGRAAACRRASRRCGGSASGGAPGGGHQRKPANGSAAAGSATSLLRVAQAGNGKRSEQRRRDLGLLHDHGARLQDPGPAAAGGAAGSRTRAVRPRPCRAGRPRAARRSRRCAARPRSPSAARRPARCPGCGRARRRRAGPP